MKKYYFAEGNEQKGPYSIEELKNYKISATTLIWREGLNDWVEATSLKELETLFKSVPPPLTKEKYNKPIHSKSTTKIKDELRSQKFQTKVAKEIKFTGKIFLYSIILGLLSYPFFAYKGFKAIYLKNEYVKCIYGERNNYEIDTMDYAIREKITNLVPESLERYYVFTSYWNEENVPRWWYTNILDYYIAEMKSTNLEQTFVFFIASFLIIIFGRAIYFGVKKGVSWVDENSKKEL